MRIQISNVIKFVLALTLHSIFFTQIAIASERGELLYKNHCQSCHDTDVHVRENSRVTSPEELRAWVISMVVHSELPWSQEEIADITAYLNRTIYHFTD